MKQLSLPPCCFIRDGNAKIDNRAHLRHVEMVIVMNVYWEGGGTRRTNYATEEKRKLVRSVAFVACESLAERYEVLEYVTILNEGTILISHRDLRQSFSVATDGNRQFVIWIYRQHSANKYRCKTRKENVGKKTSRLICWVGGFVISVVMTKCILIRFFQNV